MTRPMQALALTLVLLAGLVAATGCKDNDDPVVPQTPQYTLPFPETPDQLMTNFRTAYRTQDLATYGDEVLAATYTFVLQEATVEEFGLTSNLIDRAGEIAVSQDMFNAVPNSLGQVIAAIEVQSLQGQGDWLPVPATDLHFGGIPGALVRNYNVLIYFNLTADFRYEVRGDELFYVVPDTVEYEGAMTPRYRLCGQLDQTSISPKAGTESSNWSGVKALWF